MDGFHPGNDGLTENGSRVCTGQHLAALPGSDDLIRPPPHPRGSVGGRRRPRCGSGADLEGVVATFCARESNILATVVRPRIIKGCKLITIIYFTYLVLIATSLTPPPIYIPRVLPHINKTDKTDVDGSRDPPQ